LIRQAHFSGLIDCSKADLSDRNWQLKASWAIDYLEEQNLLKLSQMRHELSCAMLANSEMTDKAGDSWEAAMTQQDLVTGWLFPWLRPETYGQSREHSVNRLRALWESRWGNPTDPEVVKKIQNTVEYLQGMVRSRNDAAK
jgi:hypothetical protein